MQSRHQAKEGGEDPTLLVVGDLNVDLVLGQINELPALEVERCVESMEITLGGSAAILAANAAALGVQVGFSGRTGDDQFAQVVREVLSQRGVDISHVTTSAETPTGVTVIYTYGPDRGMITYPGAMQELSIEDIPWDYLGQRVQHLHLSSFYLQKALRPDCRGLFKRAKEAGMTTSLDTNWDPDERWEDDVLDLLEYVDVFLPNDEEARLISGRGDLNEAMELLGQHGCTVVVTCGAEGVVALSGEKRVHLEGLPIEPIDAVGAGDSFNAGFLQQYIEKKPIEICLQQGLLSSAFSTQKAGGIRAFDDVSEFSTFMRKHEDHLKFPIPTTSIS